MTDQNKPTDADQVNVTNANNDGVGGAGEASSNFQPKIDTNQAGASVA